jgi:ABC-2 type transport system ATP-binding protein
MSAPVAAATGVRFAYGARRVLDQVDVSVAAGEIFGVVGADGAGKSTLLRLMIGQLVPTDGRISVLGMAPRDARLRHRIAYMPQSFGQYLDLSVQENLEFFADLHGLDRATARTVIMDLLSRTGLKGFEARRAGQLSGGMMQKLALACALVSQPRAMFLDEPTTGVDPVSRRAFWQLLDAVRAQGVAILYATANMDEAERCDRVGLLQDGRFIRQGTPLELMARPDARLLTVAGPDARAWRERVRTLTAVKLAFPIGRQIKVWLAAGFEERDLRAQVAALAPHLQVIALDPSLQDIALHDLALAGANVNG